MIDGEVDVEAAGCHRTSSHSIELDTLSRPNLEGIDKENEVAIQRKV